MHSPLVTGSIRIIPWAPTERAASRTGRPVALPTTDPTNGAKRLVAPWHLDGISRWNPGRPGHAVLAGFLLERSTVPYQALGGDSALCGARHVSKQEEEVQ